MKPWLLVLGWLDLRRCASTLFVLAAAAAGCFGATPRQGQVYVARENGIVNNQCVGATPVTQFTTADTTVYLYAVIDNPQAGESLTVMWESPTGAGDSLNGFAPLDRAYTSVCFSDSLRFSSGFPAGVWKVHLLWNSGASSSEISTVQFTVTSPGGGGGSGVSLSLQTVLQQANLQAGTYTNTSVLAAQGLTIVANPSGTPGAAGTGQLQISAITPNEVHPAGTSTEAQLNGPGIGYNVLNCTTLKWTGSGRLADFTITRPGVKNGASMPAWSMYALDSAGTELARTGEGNLNTGSILMPADYKTFTISSAAAMDRVVFCSRNAGSTYNALPLSGGGTGGGGGGGGGTLTGTWQLTATGCNFVAAPGTWQATLSLTEAATGALTGTVLSNTPPIGDYTTVPPTIGSGSKRSGSSVELYLTPSGWISTFEFKGAISGSQITGTVVRNGSTACTGGFTLGGGSTGGGAPGISVSPSTLDFDLFNVGQSLDKTVVITNNGTAALTVSALSVSNLSGGNFTVVSPATPFTVQANGQQTVTVRFTPQAAGTSTGRLTITSNANTSPTTVSLIGTGVTPGGGTITTLTGTWQLTATGCNFVAAPGTWQATLSLTEASTGALTGTVLTNTPPIGDYTTVPPTIGSGSKRSGSSVELYLTPSGWISTFEFKGAISGSQITGTVVRNGATACSGGFTLGGGSTGGGGAPGISVSPSTLDFGQFNVGQSLDKTVVITNNGTAALTVSALSVSNLSGGNFTVVSPATPFTVQANGQQTVTVRFTPQAAGTSTGRLTITSNANTSPTTVSLIGTGSTSGGTITTLTGTWQLTATGCNFVAAPGAWQATLSLTEAATGALTGTVLSNTPPIGDYTTVPPTIGSGSKRSGSSVELYLTPSGWISTFEFKGAISGSQITGTVVRNGATACSGGFTLGGGSTGGGGAPGISVSPSTLDFGQFNVGQSLDKTVVITNNGTAALTVSALTVSNLSGGNFTVVSPAPFTVQANGQQTVTVRFTPQAAGTSTGRLTITSNANTSPTTVSLIGTGVTPSVGSCDYNLPTSVSVPGAGLLQDSILFRVDTKPECTWTASRPASENWITITSPAAGTAAKGSGAVLVSIPRNSGSPRTGTVTVTGTDGPHSVRVTQGAQAGPVISSGGVVNAASYASASPPNGGIAQGSYLSIFGSGLGPNQPVQAAAAPAPLTATLGGVSIRLANGSTSVDLLPTFVASSQINAIVTSDAPLGTGQLTVTYNGVTSDAAPVRIVKNALGIFTMGSDSTAGIIQTFPPWAPEGQRPLNTRSNTAAPGDYGIVWATGLGANVVNGTLLSDSEQPQPNGRMDVPITITIGGVPLSASQMPWQGRSGYNGVDNVYFIVPEGVRSGCAVPVQIQVGDVPANPVTIAIDTQRRPCVD